MTRSKTSSVSRWRTTWSSTHGSSRTSTCRIWNVLLPSLTFRTGSWDFSSTIAFQPRILPRRTELYFHGQSYLLSLLIFLYFDACKLSMTWSHISSSKLLLPEMEITKIKVHRLCYRFSIDFLNPYPKLWFSCWKSQAFGKYREIFCSRIFAEDF